MNNKITFYLGEETRPILENSERRKTSIFKDQYQKAEELFDSILKSNREVLDKNDIPFSEIEKGTANNILAFVGDRGSGKTSCMLTFSKIIDKRNELGKQYHVMDTIDPSLFEEKTNNNILELIIGRIFGIFKERNDRYRETPNYRSNEVRDLMQSFQEVKKQLGYLESSMNGVYNDIEDLNSLAGAEKLRKLVFYLVEDFLRYVKAKTLVISLDDIDLNTKNAYRMVEQVRKYMILPNVVILMAVKFSQLQQVITQQMLIENKALLDRNVILETDIEEMSERYVDKLIPHRARIILPNVSSLFYKVLEIRESVDSENSLNLGRATLLLSELVPVLIYKKCRYLFYNRQGKTSPIIPRNLRELRMLIHMLSGMKDYQRGSGAEYNMLLFKQYFFDTWVESLSSSYKKVARECIAEDNPAHFNKKVVNQLHSVFFQSSGRSDSYFSNTKFEVPNFLQEVVSINNKSYNVSLGDAFAVINHLEKVVSAKEDHSLLFFIKTLYSMRLYDLYKEITPDEILKREEASLHRRPNIRQLEISLNDSLNECTNFEKIVGGNYYTFEDTNLNINSGRETYPRTRLIDGKLLYELINELNECISKGKTFSVNKLLVAEFFLFTCNKRESLRVHEVKFFNFDKSKYREHSDAYYTRKFDNVRNLVFDIYAPVNNILNCKNIYTRYDIAGQTVYREAKVNPKSLYSRLVDISSSRANEINIEENPEYDLLSVVAMKNSEVIDYLASMMTQHRIRGNKNDDFQKLAAIYNRIARFSIPTYDLETDSNGKFIWSIFSVFSGVLNTIGKDKDCRQLFYDIYYNYLDELEINLKKIIGDYEEMEAVKFLSRVYTTHAEWKTGHEKQILEEARAINGLQPVSKWKELYTKLYKEFNNIPE